MHFISNIAILLLVVLSCNVECQPIDGDVEDTAMLQILDAMQQLMTGGQEYDREYYQELRTCLDVFDPNLRESQDNAWQGFINYWLTGGAIDDPWGESGTVYLEQNATNSEFLNMTIYEPCNYASNVAYYHDVTEFCNRISGGKAFSLPDQYVNSFGNMLPLPWVHHSCMEATRGLVVNKILVQSEFFHMLFIKESYQRFLTVLQF